MNEISKSKVDYKTLLESLREIAHDARSMTLLQKHHYDHDFLKATIDIGIHALCTNEGLSSTQEVQEAMVEAIKSIAKPLKNLRIHLLSCSEPAVFGLDDLERANCADLVSKIDLISTVSGVNLTHASRVSAKGDFTEAFRDR